MRFRLLTKLHERKMDVSDLAMRLKLHPSKLQAKLLGTKPFTLEEIEGLLKLFPDCTLEDLFPKEEDAR